MSSTIQVLEPTKLVTHRLRHGGLELSVANFAEDRLLNNYLEHHQVWEPWQLDLMLRVIKPHFTCVDVGANVGINALFASQLCPRGRVLAYEPFAAIFQVLQHNLARNPSQNVEAIPMGLSDASASLQMVAHTSCVGLAHVAPAGQDTGDGATEIARFQRLEDQMRE
jgi:FkbM family methyltransferase